MSQVAVPSWSASSWDEVVHLTRKLVLMVEWLRRVLAS